MTTRHLIDRAILRACNHDTRFAGVWDFLSCLSGNEREIAFEIVSLGAGGGDADALARKFLRCQTIDDLMSTVESASAISERESEGETGSLF